MDNFSKRSENFSQPEVSVWWEWFPTTIMGLAELS